MFHPLQLLAQLPKIRTGLLLACLLAGCADLITSIVLLAYQLALTTGFNRVVPSLVVTSFLTALIPVWFVYSKPYAIRLPTSSASVPAAGSKRDVVARFTRSVMAELICLGGVAAWTLITVSDLHAETPGLIDNCGGWTICRMLLAVFSLTWISFLFQSLAFASLLVSTLYFSIRRHSPIPTLLTSFDQVDWVRYSGRPVNRSATVKRTRQKASKQNTESVEDDVAELKAPPRSRFGGQVGGPRPDSQVPVLARSIHSTMGSISTTRGFGGDDSITIDWDTESSRFSTAGAPPKHDGSRDSTASARPEQVFILVTEKEQEQEQEQEKEQAGSHGTTGTAL
ncbi:hypothetical protein JCM3766R1_006578 [Sporobolomyces carnicolor]